MRKNGVHVANSPFKIMVGQSEIGEASRVKAFGKGLVEAHTSEMAEFFVDTRNAGELQREPASPSATGDPTLQLFLCFPSGLRLRRTRVVDRGSKQSGHKL